MAEQRFVELSEELLRAGVAPRLARRAVLELGSHFRGEVGAGIGTSTAALSAQSPPR